MGGGGRDEHRTPPSRLPVMKNLSSDAMHVTASRDVPGWTRATPATLVQNLQNIWDAD